MVFDVTPAGTITPRHSFCSQANCADGADSDAALVQATNGNFYGTTRSGGAHNDGTVFEISAGGKLTTLYSFCAQTSCADGSNPIPGLVQATNGNLYGTTEDGGANSVGTVFDITAAGKLTTLYSFCSQTGCADGGYPQGMLIQATNGRLYGTTEAGGSHTGGTVFQITPAGKLTTVYNFLSAAGGTDGSQPEAGLVQATDGNFYGTTTNYGKYSNGTVFELTAAGKLTTLYNFCSKTGCADGNDAAATLVQATDGNFYGTTNGGGANSYGALFEITPGGTFTTLYSFCSQLDCKDGANPDRAGLLQPTNGNFYGTAGDGPNGVGEVFVLKNGLKPFVKTQPTSGQVGVAVTILGNKLTGASSVTFNGATATFKVVSSCEITTTVPSGATTGPVKVVTPSGTLISNVNFRV
jgi:uncharacterized repeat protein (TIGR03803 family)